MEPLNPVKMARWLDIEVAVTRWEISIQSIVGYETMLRLASLFLFILIVLGASADAEEFRPLARHVIVIMADDQDGS